MNKVTLIGRLTRDPNVRYTQNSAEPMAVARYTLAVDRRGRRNNDGQDADFIDCVAFGRQGEFAEKYLHKGMKIAVNGRIQTGSYTNRDGQKVYTTDVVVEDHEFVESKNAQGGGNYGGGNQNYSQNQNYGANRSYGSNQNYGGANQNAGGRSYGSDQNRGPEQDQTAGRSYGSNYDNNAGQSGTWQDRNRPQAQAEEAPQAPADDFMNIPDGIDEELPFN